MIIVRLPERIGAIRVLAALPHTVAPARVREARGLVELERRDQAQVRARPGAGRGGVRVDERRLDGHAAPAVRGAGPRLEEGDGCGERALVCVGAPLGERLAGGFEHGFAGAAAGGEGEKEEGWLGDLVFRGMRSWETYLLTILTTWVSPARATGGAA
jgi:hypothetical protein